MLHHLITKPIMLDKRLVTITLIKSVRKDGGLGSASHLHYSKFESNRYALNFFFIISSLSEKCICHGKL